MDILQQCQIWNEKEEYQKIIDALEAVSVDMRTPEMDSELARAYANAAEPYESEGRAALRHAIDLLKPHEAYFRGDHCWNFRMGYAYFYLEQEGRALPYFENALDARPGDEDTLWFIDTCRSLITLPRFQENFRQRTLRCWEVFAEKEAELRCFMDEDTERERGGELIERCGEILELAFDDIAFEMGFNGEKYELILTPEGDRVKLFELVYFQKHTPKEVEKHWNILVGRQPNAQIGMRADDIEISGDDVQIWLEKLGEKSFALSAYCEKLSAFLEEEEVRVWWILTTLTDQILGEISHMMYIDDFDVLKAPKEETPVLLSQLPEKLSSMGMELTTAPARLLKSYTGYELKPDKDTEADWRLDVMAGTSNCIPLLAEYMSGKSDYMDALHADGAAAGFFCYPIDGFSGENKSQQIFDFRDSLEDWLIENCGEDTAVFLGGATGLYCGYLDFIAWDLKTLLHTAQEFFEESALPWAAFHVFRREAGTVSLKEPENEPSENEPEDENAVMVIDECESEMKRRKRLLKCKKNQFVPGKVPFEHFDFTDFWDDSDYALKEYVSKPPTDELIASVEAELGYKLPKAYIQLMKQHNGGIPENTCFPTKEPTSWAEDHVAISGIFGIGREKDYALCGELGSQFMIDEWGYPAIGVAVCDCPSAGHDMIFLDYRECGPLGEPKVVHVDQENDYKITHLADSFEEFICGLENEEFFYDYDEDFSDNEISDVNSKGMFAGFVLMSEDKWDKQQFIADLEEKWNIAAEEDEEEKRDDSIVFEVGHMIAAVSLMSYPVPGGEAERNAENNYMWPEAVDTAKKHSAHIMVAVFGEEADVIEKGKLFTKLTAVCCEQKYASGVYTSGTVFEPEFYKGCANLMKEDELPVYNWIWFGLYRSEHGISAYTYGMDVFGKDEMEVLDAAAEPEELRYFLADLTVYVLENDVTLEDGETIGFSAEDIHTIERSEGVFLPGMTLKISYEPSEPGAERFEDRQKQM